MASRARSVLLLLTAACGSPDESAKQAPPATVENKVAEADLTRVVLTEAAEKRLGVTLGAVEKKAVNLARVLPGAVEPMPGGSASLSAPVAGLLSAPGGTPPAPGRKVARGEILWQLSPLVADQPDVRARSDRDLSAARARAEAARSKAARTETLVKAGAASLRAAEEARTELRVAEADLDEATRRRARPGLTSDLALALRAPEAGTILRVGVGSGQVVTAGAPLVEIARVDRAWIRVAIYVGDLTAVDRSRAAEVRPLGGAGRAVAARPAEPVNVPPLAQPKTPSVEIVYSIENGDAAFLPGQRVSVALPLAREGESLVVPTTAVVYDIHGGSWVYQPVAPHAFARRRVEVARVDGDLAILARGPEAGTQVVTTGASELFGTEFGAGK